MMEYSTVANRLEAINYQFNSGRYDVGESMLKVFTSDLRFHGELLGLVLALESTDFHRREGLNSLKNLIAYFRRAVPSQMRLLENLNGG